LQPAGQGASAPFVCTRSFTCAPTHGVNQNRKTGHRMI